MSKFPKVQTKALELSCTVSDCPALKQGSVPEPSVVARVMKRPDWTSLGHMWPWSEGWRWLLTEGHGLGVGLEQNPEENEGLGKSK